MASPIQIRITEEGTTQGLIGSNMNAVQPNLQARSDAKIVAKSVYATMLANSAINATKSVFMAQASMYGDTTGDYVAQTKIDNTFTLAGNLLSVGSAIGTGFATGGVVGAVVGGIVSLGSLAVNEFNQYRKVNLENIKTNAGARFNSAQIGSILINGNRGGY